MDSKFTVRLTNQSVGTANFAIVDFDVSYPYTGGLTEAQIAAQLLYYFQDGIYAASGTSIDDISARPAGSAGAHHVPFPVVEYAAVQAANPSHTIPMIAYGTVFGSGAISPIGTSITVSEYTAIAGRSYQGRHYLPFVGAGSIASDGLLSTAVVASVHAAYNDAILGGVGAPVVDLVPLVHSTKLGTDTPIVSVTVSATPSNLKTRRR